MIVDTTDSAAASTTSECTCAPVLRVPANDDLIDLWWPAGGVRTLDADRSTRIAQVQFGTQPISCGVSLRRIAECSDDERAAVLHPLDVALELHASRGCRGAKAPLMIVRARRAGLDSQSVEVDHHVTRASMLTNPCAFPCERRPVDQDHLPHQHSPG